MTYDEVLAFAFGELGLTPSEYYKMTPVEFFLLCRGHSVRTWKKWEHTRFIGYNVISTIPRKKGRRMPSITKWFPLPTDKKLREDLDIQRMDNVWQRLKKKLADGK